MKRRQSHFWALVLAGGDGTRLQELTRRLTGVAIPKQYCRILGERSLLEATLDRLDGWVAAERTLTVINRSHSIWAEPQLASLPATNVLAQPCNRDTGPGILLSLLEIARRDPEAMVGVFPSDHDVRDQRAFARCIVEMNGVVARHPKRIALLGVRPDFADPGLGYLAIGERLPRESGPTYRVRAFHEKPNAEAAARLIRRGGLWNTFVMVGRVARFLELLHSVVPQELERLRGVRLDSESLRQAYDLIPAWNFSREFLRHVAGDLAVVRGDHLGWSDWGTPEAVERTFVALGLVPSWRHTRTA